MESILEEFYLGGINPSEDNKMMLDEDYSQTRKESYEAEERLEKTLSEEQKELLNKFLNTMAGIEYSVAKYSFIRGYIIGVKMMMEILK